MKAPVAATLVSWGDHSVDPATEDSEEAILASPETSCSDVVVVDSAEIEVLSKAKVKIYVTGGQESECWANNQTLCEDSEDAEGKARGHLRLSSAGGNLPTEKVS